MIKHILNGDQIIAIIIPASHTAEGIEFVTPGDFSQQLAYMNRPAGYTIEPHVHNPVTRRVNFTQEVLIIKSGSLRVDFYSDSIQYLQSTVLSAGDVILLASGGHGFEMMENCEIIEVKQGPYAGDADKSRFPSVYPDRIIIE